MKAILWRILRTSLATAVSVYTAKWQADPAYLWISPALLSLGKALRVRWPALADVLPF